MKKLLCKAKHKTTGNRCTWKAVVHGLCLTHYYIYYTGGVPGNKSGIKPKSQQAEVTA